MNIQTVISRVTAQTERLWKGDHCDACGFQARFIITTMYGEFWLCGHDWNNLKESMNEILLAVHEQSFEDAFRPKDYEASRDETCEPARS